MDKQDYENVLDLLFSEDIENIKLAFILSNTFKMKIKTNIKDIIKSIISSGIIKKIKGAIFLCKFLKISFNNLLKQTAYPTIGYNDDIDFNRTQICITRRSGNIINDKSPIIIPDNVYDLTIHDTYPNTILQINHDMKRISVYYDNVCEIISNNQIKELTLFIGTLNFKNIYNSILLNSINNLKIENKGIVGHTVQKFDLKSYDIDYLRSLM